MTRYSWTTLPSEVSAAVESVLTAHVTQPISVDHTTADLAELLDLDTGSRVFVKGTRVLHRGMGNDPAAVLLAKETRVLRELPRGWAPAVLFLLDVAGWRLIGTDYIHGPRADLTPGSPDVESVAHALAALAVNPAVARSPLPTLPTLAYTLAADEPWQRLVTLAPTSWDRWTATQADEFADGEPHAAALCAGHALTHTAIHPAELVLSPRWVTVLDWRHAHLGPPWADLAVLAALLIEYGHDPGEAEEVVSRNPVWRTANPAAITAHAVEVYGRWELRRHQRPHPRFLVNASAWRAWAIHRWQQFPVHVRRL